ncbi:MAG: hypothetical protein AAGJ35_07015 [Myxococcota bacterium]
MSLIKPSDFQAWKGLGIGTIAVLVLASLAYAFLSSYASEKGVQAAKRQPVDVTQTSPSAPEDKISADASDTNSSSKESNAMGGIFNSLGDPKR